MSQVIMSNIFGVRISSTIYYRSLTEALLTFIIMTISTSITTGIFIHTIYKFFCEKIAIFDGEVIDTKKIKKTNEEEPTESHTQSARRLSQRPNSLVTRSRGGSKSSSQPTHSKEISFIIALLTICYLLTASIYTFINWLIRLLMIFFNINFSCYVLGYIQISYILIKISFYILFIIRLHLTFQGSNLSVKPLYLKLICIISSFLLIL
eukprot:2761_1